MLKITFVSFLLWCQDNSCLSNYSALHKLKVWRRNFVSESIDRCRTNKTSQLCGDRASELTSGEWLEDTSSTYQSSSLGGKKISLWERLVLFGLDGCTLQNELLRGRQCIKSTGVCTPGIRGQRATRSSDKLGRQVLIKNSRATAEEFKSIAEVTAT